MSECAISLSISKRPILFDITFVAS
jgi:hypothetical protein